MPDQPRSHVLLRGPKNGSANSNAIDAAIDVTRVTVVARTAARATGRGLSTTPALATQLGG